MSHYGLIRDRLGYAAALGETDIEGAIEYAWAQGFRAVELNANVPEFFPERYPAPRRREIRKFAEAKGISLSFHAPEDICLIHLHESVRLAGLARLKEVLDLAGDIGAGRVTIHIGNSVYFTYETGKQHLYQVYPVEFRRILRSSLVEIRDYAAGKTLPCIENVNYFGKLVVQEVLAEMLPEGGLYLTWDWGHSFNNPEQTEFMESHIEYVRNCHVHDHDGKSDHLAPGSGQIDFKAFFNRLRGNDASFIIEVRPRERACVGRERICTILEGME